MPTQRSQRAVLDLFSAKNVVDLLAIRDALGGTSAMTAFRFLRTIHYRRSYNHNGRYYTLHEPSRYDRFGLWSWGDVHFSVDGSLKDTVRRLVHEADAGATHRELQDRLHVRVHNALLGLLRAGEIDREQMAQVYVYLHTEASVREAQLGRRREKMDAAAARGGLNGSIEVSEEVIILVLLTLIRHPSSKVADVTRRLRGCAPPITVHQVRAVFARYDLDALGEKGGASSS